MESQTIMYFTFLKKKTLTYLAISIALIVIASLLLSFTGASAVFYGKPLKKLPIYYVKTEEKKLAISFDCAWGTDYTDELLSVMQQRKVKCTFFMVEFWTKKHPDYVKKIWDFGHEIGTHSATHPYMSKLSRERIINELTTSSKAIQDITGTAPKVFRAPYGDYNDLLIQTATDLNLYTIQWDVDSLDWKDLSASEIVKRVTSRVKNGSIVLFHNQGLHTAKALPTILDTLMQQGYSFVPIGDLIYKDNYTVGADGGQIKNS